MSQLPKHKDFKGQNLHLTEQCTVQQICSHTVQQICSPHSQSKSRNIQLDGSEFMLSTWRKFFTGFSSFRASFFGEFSRLDPSNYTILTFKFEKIELHDVIVERSKIRSERLHQMPRTDAKCKYGTKTCIIHVSLDFIC